MNVFSITEWVGIFLIAFCLIISFCFTLWIVPSKGGKK